MKARIIIALGLCAIAIIAVLFPGNRSECWVCGDYRPCAAFPVYVENIKPGSPIRTFKVLVCAKDRAGLAAKSPILSCSKGVEPGAKVDVVFAFGEPMDWTQSKIKIAGRPETDTARDNEWRDYTKHMQ